MPQNIRLLFFIAPGFKVEIGSKPQRRPGVVREIPEEMQRTGSIVAHGGRIIVVSAVLSMVQADMNRAAQFGKVPIEISKKKFDVAAEELVVFLRKIPVRPVGLQMFGAEHPHRPLKLEPAQRKIKCGHQPKPRFPQKKLDRENRHHRQRQGDHQP